MLADPLPAICVVDVSLTDGVGVGVTVAAAASEEEDAEADNEASMLLDPEKDEEGETESRSFFRSSSDVTPEDDVDVEEADGEEEADEAAVLGFTVVVRMATMALDDQRKKSLQWNGFLRLQIRQESDGVTHLNSMLNQPSSTSQADTATSWRRSRHGLMHTQRPTVRTRIEEIVGRWKSRALCLGRRCTQERRLGVSSSIPPASSSFETAGPFCSGGIV